MVACAMRLGALGVCLIAGSALAQTPPLIIPPYGPSINPTGLAPGIYPVPNCPLFYKVGARNEDACWILARVKEHVAIAANILVSVNDAARACFATTNTAQPPTPGMCDVLNQACDALANEFIVEHPIGLTQYPNPHPRDMAYWYAFMNCGYYVATAVPVYHDPRPAEERTPPGFPQ